MAPKSNADSQYKAFLDMSAAQTDIMQWPEVEQSLVTVMLDKLDDSGTPLLASPDRAAEVAQHMQMHYGRLGSAENIVPPFSKDDLLVLAGKYSVYSSLAEVYSAVKPAAQPTNLSNVPTDKSKA